MNILFVISTADVNSWVNIHIFDELSSCGHSILTFNIDLYSCKDQVNSELLRKIKTDSPKIDLLVCFEGCSIFPEIIQGVKSHGTLTLLFLNNNLHVPYTDKDIAPFFDLVWLTSFETMSLIQKWGCNCLFLPYAANPRLFKPIYRREIKGIGFIGNLYGTRSYKINDLLNANIPCFVYSSSFSGSKTVKIGTPLLPKIKISVDDLVLLKFSVGRRIIWSKVVKRFFMKQQQLLLSSPFLNQFPAVSFEEMNVLYSNFSISLGITEVWDTYVLKRPIHKLHLRTFEIPMCGGLQLVPYIKELAGYFEEDKEIIFYRSKEEYVDKAHYYLQDSKSQLRMAMKKAARRHAEQEHTWSCRFDKIFSQLNLRQK